MRYGIKVIGIGLVFALWTATFGGAQSQPEWNFLNVLNDFRLRSEVCWDGHALVRWPVAGTPKLRMSPALSKAALAHNRAMIETGCTDHTCPGEPGLPQRAALAGYPTQWDFLSENIAGGFETAKEVFAAWAASPGHHRNMLTCYAHAVGISRVYESTAPAWWYWTTDFGDVIDAAAPPAPDKGQTSIADAADANDDGRIGDKDILKAITAWVLGEDLPGSDLTLDDADILLLIALWVTGQPV